MSREEFSLVAFFYSTAQIDPKAPKAPRNVQGTFHCGAASRDMARFRRALRRGRPPRRAPDFPPSDFPPSDFEQLRYAAELGMYQEAFRTVEDIRTLQARAGRQPHPLTMVAQCHWHYYARLSEGLLGLWDCQLCHAYAWYKIDSLSLEETLLPEGGEFPPSDFG